MTVGQEGEFMMRPPELRAGMVAWDRYRLEKELGRGGMGVVWLAQDERLDRRVAVKFLPRAMANDEDAVEALKTETKRAMELTHPHIIRVHDFAHAGDLAGVVMEQAVGGSLAERRSERPGGYFEPAEILAWVEQLGAALDYSHQEARVVHRDLKPANLLLDEAGQLKVADFGIAATLSETATRLSREVGSSGTPAFMSPQQMLGKSPRPTDDIYAMGATIYDLLTGKPPFFRGDLNRQVQAKPPSSMAERRQELAGEGGETNVGEITEAWECAVAACLAKEPEERPATAGEVVALLKGKKLGRKKKIPVATMPAEGREKERSGVRLSWSLVSMLGLLVGGWAWFGGWDKVDEDVVVEPVAAQHIAEVVMVEVIDESGGSNEQDEVVEVVANLEPMAPVEADSLTVGGVRPRFRDAAMTMSEVAFTVDGQSVSLVNGELRELERGARWVGVMHPDYEPWLGEVEVKARETVTVEVALKGKLGTLVMETKPEGVAVRIIREGPGGDDRWNNEIEKDQLTPFRSLLPPGDYRLMFVLLGHRATERRLGVSANREQSLHVEMEQTEPLEGRPWVVPGLGMELMPIPAGTFVMGGVNSGSPIVTVTISSPFWLGKTEVTRGQWQSLMRWNFMDTFRDGDPNLPVDSVSWEEAMEYCRRLTLREGVAGRLPSGYHYTLPTEAQWEYACRAGTRFEYGGTGFLDDMGWYIDNSRGKTQPVGTKRANAWGLHDMHGNVEEWCLDWGGNLRSSPVVDPRGPASGVVRIVRGGSFSSPPNLCSSYFRQARPPDPNLKEPTLGFRVALSRIP